MNLEKNKTATLLFFFLTVTQFSTAQSSDGLTFTPSFSAIIVQDIDQSKEWYINVLKLEVVNTFESEERGFKIINLANKNFQLELLELKTAVNPKEVIQGVDQNTRIVGLFKTGFKVKDFDSWIRHLRVHTVNFQGNIVTDPATNKRMLVVRDPDGNRIQFFE